MAEPRDSVSGRIVEHRDLLRVLWKFLHLKCHLLLGRSQKWHREISEKVTESPFSFIRVPLCWAVSTFWCPSRKWTFAAPVLCLSWQVCCDPGWGQTSGIWCPHLAARKGHCLSRCHTPQFHHLRPAVSVMSESPCDKRSGCQPKQLADGICAWVSSDLNWTLSEIVLYPKVHKPLSEFSLTIVPQILAPVNSCGPTQSQLRAPRKSRLCCVGLWGLMDVASQHHRFLIITLAVNILSPDSPGLGNMHATQLWIMSADPPPPPPSLPHPNPLVKNYHCVPFSSPIYTTFSDGNQQFGSFKGDGLGEEQWGWRKGSFNFSGLLIEVTESQLQSHWRGTKENEKLAQMMEKYGWIQGCSSSMGPVSLSLSLLTSALHSLHEPLQRGQMLLQPWLCPPWDGISPMTVARVPGVPWLHRYESWAFPHGQQRRGKAQGEMGPFSERNFVWLREGTKGSEQIKTTEPLH